WRSCEHFGKESQPHGDDLAILSKSSDSSIEEGVLIFRAITEVVRATTVGQAKCGQHLSGMQQVEEIDRCKIVTLDKPHLQCAHEASRRHAEVIPHHHNALQPPAVALPQGLHQFRAFVLLGMQPLLELIEDNQHLVARWYALPTPE